MKRYLLVFTILALAVGVAVTVFNYQVDPYRIYHPHRADEQSLGRINQFFHYRLTKPWRVVRTRPTAIITGTSRSAGMHPQHLMWPANSSYNLSIPGQTMYEMLRFIEHAQANGPIRKLMIGVDFEAFIQPDPRTKPGFEESRLLRESTDLGSLQFLWRRLIDARDTLASIDGLTRSMAALTGTDKVGIRFHEDGSWETTTKLYTGQGGYIFYAREHILKLLDQPLGLDANLDIFADILRFAHENRIDTRIFVTPEHVFMVDLWWRLGYGELWEDFHRSLVAVNDDVARQLGEAPFPLFGFNQMPGVVDEPIELARAAGQSMFSDGSHFGPALGDRIMTGVWTQGSQIGMRLDAGTVEEYLAQVERMRVQFEAGNVSVTSKLRQGISPDLQ